MGEYIQINGKVVKASLTVYYIQNEDTITAYCPSLELSTYGDSLEDTKEAFKDVFEIFIEYTLEQGTLEEQLLEMGWREQAAGTFSDYFQRAAPKGDMIVVQHQLLQVA